MAYILNIETSSRNCSVALFNKSELISSRSLLCERYSHSELLNKYIEQVLERINVNLSDLDAICVGKGPGSYTGLRVGSSSAKGLCYALDIPLISLSSLDIMMYEAIDLYPSFDLYCPMIDARRMEVFSAVYNNENKIIQEVSAEVIDEKSYQCYSEDKILFFGDGSAKCKHLINNVNAEFIEDIFPCSKNMGEFAYKKFQKEDFEDLAYFEPFYLKDFLIRKKTD